MLLENAPFCCLLNRFALDLCLLPSYIAAQNNKIQLRQSHRDTPSLTCSMLLTKSCTGDSSRAEQSTRCTCGSAVVQSTEKGVGRLEKISETACIAVLYLHRLKR